jgi:uncharacterized protein
MLHLRYFVLLIFGSSRTAARPFELSIYLLGVLAAAFITGVTGFAFGLVAAAIWLYALAPTDSTFLIGTYALLVQGFAVWKLRGAIVSRRLLPFVVGSAAGVPGGALLLQYADAAQLRFMVGVLLIAFASYSLTRPAMPVVRHAGPPLDLLASVLNGVIGACTGLGGLIVNIWCSVRGWSSDEQRAVFQPTAVVTFLITVLWLGGSGAVSEDAGWLFVIGLPALIVGTLAGWKAYGRLDPVRFRRTVLYVLLGAGVVLTFTSPI